MLASIKQSCLVVLRGCSVTFLLQQLFSTLWKVGFPLVCCSTIWEMEGHEMFGIARLGRKPTLHVLIQLSAHCVKQQKNTCTGLKRG